MKAKLLILLALTLVLGIVSAGAVAAPANPGVSPPQASFRGNSYGAWHALWWQWADSFTNAQSPVWQQGGTVNTGNQSGNVWFLAGYFGDWFDTSNPVIFTREITIPSGTALFFPILNGELTPGEWQWDWILVNYPDAKAWSKDPANAGKSMDEAIAELGVTNLPEPSAQDLWELLDSWFADPEQYVEAMSASVDGKPLKNLGGYMARAPAAYTTWLPVDNHISFYYPDGGDVYPVVADGWCLLLEPLAVGQHIVKFKANFGGTLGMDITYKVTVVAAGKAKK